MQKPVDQEIDCIDKVDPSLAGEIDISSLDDSEYEEYTEEPDLLGHTAIPDAEYESAPCIKEVNQNFIRYVKESFDYNNDAKLNAALHFLTVARKNFTQQAIYRSSSLYNIVKEVFESEGVPYQIGIGLVSVESAWKVRALSRARAAGLFQFIRGTGQRYGLRRTSHIEERYHIIKAARASANYLKDLYSIFGDWKLSLAAYNAGENRIFRAMVNTGYTKCWHDLETGNILKRETKDYVSMILAAVIIWENPEAYDLERAVYHDSNIREIMVDKAFSPKGMAGFIGMEFDTFKALNSHLLNDSWVNPISNLTVLIPIDSHQKVAEYFADESNYKNDRSRYARQDQVSSHTYDGEYLIIKIQKGMTLSQIARRYNTNVKTLMQINNLRSTRIVAGRTLRVPAPEGYAGSSYSNIPVSEDSEGFLVIRIQRGMTLYNLARRYNTSVRELQRINNLRTSRIIAGQLLKVPNPNT